MLLASDSLLTTLIDEIEEPSDPPTTVLKYIEDHLLNALIKTLNRKELKYVSRHMLELKVLDEDGHVHTGKGFARSPPIFTNSKAKDIEPDNVLVNYKAGDMILRCLAWLSAGRVLQTLSMLKRHALSERLRGAVQK